MKINNNNNFDDITPIPSGELIKKILSKQSPVKSYHLKFRNININYLEKKIGISSEKMKELSASYDFDFNIDIKFRQQPHMGKFLYETIKSKIPPLGKNMKGYKVKTEDGSFDLIKDNLLYYDMPIEIPDMMDQSNYQKLNIDIQKGIVDILIKNRDNIIQTLAENPSLDDFDSN